MNNKFPLILCSALIVYSVMALCTTYSLTGFWTDIVCSISLFVCSLIVTFRHKANTRYLTVALRAISICFFVVVLHFLSPFNTIFFADTFKLRSFYFIRVDDRIFNAYFKPVGAYSGGYGNFLVTESPHYFPLIEHPVYYNRTSHHDFSEDTFEGQAIDNKEIIRQIILENILHKN
jgi:hypothetical protein